MTKPDALALADALEADRPVCGPDAKQAAAELRRLHAEVERLSAAMAATPAPAEPAAWMIGDKDERAAFDAWAEGFGLPPTSLNTVEPWAAWKARAALAATPAPAPLGWKLVPVEPTPEMLWALFGSFVGQLTAGERKRYAAMLAAAPEAATPAPAELEKAHEARRQAQSELAYFKARLASARLTLMRELKEQGWAPAPAPLTDEQIDKTAKRVIPVAAYMGMFEYAAFSKEDADRTVRHFARAIEAAHGIGASTKESNQ